MGLETSSQRLQCEVCKTPFTYEARALVRFPDDARPVLDTIAVEPMVWPCEVCGHRALLPPASLYFNTRTNELLVFGPEELLRESIETASKEQDAISGRIAYAAEYEDVRHRLMVWTNELLVPALTPILRDPPETWPSAADGTPLCQSYFALLALAYAGSGKLPFTIQSEPPLEPERLSSLMTSLRLLTANGAFREAYKIAFHDSRGIASLPKVVAERIPPEAVTDGVLEELREECKPIDEALKDPKLFDAAYRFEYLTAVAHRLAGKPNPNDEQWALHIMTLFLLTRQGRLTLDERFLLTPQILRDTVSSETFLRIVFAAFKLGGYEEFDRATYEQAFAVAAHFGYEQELNAALATVTMFTVDPDSKISDEELATKVGGFADRARKQFNRDAARSIIPRLCELLLLSGRSRAAILLARQQLERHTETDGELLTTLCRVSQTFNDMRACEEALALLHLFSDRFEAAMANLPVGVIVDYFNEFANTLRYLHRPDEAIRLYNAAFEASEADDKLLRERLILRRNIAIALRENDRPANSRRILLELIEEASDERDRFQTRQNLVTTLLHMRAFEEALFHARINAKVPLFTAGPRFHVLALLQLAQAKVETNTALEDELEAGMALRNQVPALQPSIISTIFVAARRTELAQPLLNAASTIVQDLPLDSQLEQTALATYAEWKADSDPEAARTAIDRIIETLGPKVSLPWQWSYLRFRLADPEAFEERWTLLLTALERLTGDVPADTAGGLLAGWLSEKEAYFNDLIVFGKRAFRRGIATASELIQIANAANGRDVVVPLQEESGERRLPHARFIAFLEDDTDVWIVATTSDGEQAEVVPDVMLTKELVAANIEFQRAIRRALPGQPSRAETLIAPLLRQVGEAVAALSQPGEQICFIPSESLVALPLHAATLADGTLLIARNPVNVSPNLGVTADLLASRRAGESDRSVIVAVPKRGDADEFIQALDHTAHELEQLIIGPAEIMRSTEATKESCTRAVRNARQAVFLCHGGDAGARYGRGLCVSDGTYVPPSLLPVAEAPSLRRFIITAEDVESWEPSPTLFATIACSSGLAIPGPGGSRLGVERSLLMNGCRTILAPMWDVDHVSALQFLIDFHRILHEDRALDLGSAYRKALMLAYDRSPHLFDWAPMQLKGSWIRLEGDLDEHPNDANSESLP